MDLVSIETFEENMMVMKLVHQRGLKDVWTSGRLCNFKGCDAKHLQPKHINGMSAVTIVVINFLAQNVLKLYRLLSINHSVKKVIHRTFYTW